MYSHCSARQNTVLNSSQQGETKGAIMASQQQDANDLVVQAQKFVTALKGLVSHVRYTILCHRQGNHRQQIDSVANAGNFTLDFLHQQYQKFAHLLEPVENRCVLLFEPVAFAGKSSFCFLVGTRELAKELLGQFGINVYVPDAAPWLARTLGNLGWRDKIGLIRKEAFRYTTCLSFQE